MFSARNLAIAAFVVTALQPVQATQENVGAPTPTPGRTPDCWVEHSQLQPSPARRPAAADVWQSGISNRLMTEEHPGAEHASRAKKPACGALPPGNGLNSALIEPRSMAR